MSKETNKPIENEPIEAVKENPKKELGEIPTDDKKILEKLDEIKAKIESFEIIDDDINEDKEKDDKKKNLGLAVAFVALAVVVVGLFSFKKVAKDENK